MSELIWSWVPWRELDRDTLYEVLALREEVFVVEQACPYLDADGRDPLAHHLLGRREGRLVAYLRAFAPGVLREEGVIGRVVTSPRVRGTGLGRPLMREGLARAEATWGPHPVWLSAQAHLAGYYGSVGFAVCGEGYLEDGIPHVPMRRPITGT